MFLVIQSRADRKSVLRCSSCVRVVLVAAIVAMIADAVMVVEFVSPGSAVSVAVGFH